VFNSPPPSSGVTTLTRQLSLGILDQPLSISGSLMPTEILMRNFIRLNVQVGLSAVLNHSYNGFFDMLPVSKLIISLLVDYCKKLLSLYYAVNGVIRTYKAANSFFLFDHIA
jgi:hypothetical protein